MWHSAPARLALLGVATLLLGGCNNNWATLDSRTLTSTVDQPTTYTLYAAMTEQSAVLWTMDIPVNHRLHVDLDRGSEAPLFQTDPQKTPSKFSWTLLSLNGNRRVDGGRIDLPNVPVYQEVTIRPAPEFPEGFNFPGADAGETGTAGEVEVEIVPATPKAESDDAATEPEAEEEKSENEPTEGE